MVIAGNAPDSEVVFAICRDGDFVGCIGHRWRAHASHLQSAAGPNIGYWLGRAYWGQGLMTEAVRAVVAHLFADPGVTAIYCGAFSDNAASLRVQDKAGFVKDGETMLLSRPHGSERPHTNTVLTRARSEALAR
jgi:RimJ/RimL family protein N-acetyltransferase